MIEKIIEKVRKKGVFLKKHTVFSVLPVFSVLLVQPAVQPGLLRAES
jgi:hypothetical protein